MRDDKGRFPVLTRNQLQEVVDAYYANGQSKRAAAKAMGLSSSTYRFRFKKAVQEKVIDLAPEEIIPEGHKLKGTSRLYDSEGNLKLEWVKTSAEQDNFKDHILEMIEGLKDELPKVKTKQVKHNYLEDTACLIPIGDAHIGMFAWDEEVHDAWDLDIAEKHMCAAFDYLIDRSPACERAFIFNVGDYFHYSKMEATTERSGHVLDAAGRPQNMVRVGIRIIRYVIEKCAEKHEYVEVVNASGNHDGLLAHALNIALENIYENDDRIIIHSQPTPRHYIRYGKNLFGVTHGHQTKDGQLPIIMASEKPEDWGITKYRRWFRGHHHHDKQLGDVEFNGAIVEQVRTFAAGDSYAIGGGYLSGRDIKLYLYNKKYGRMGNGDSITPEMLRGLKLI